MGSKPNYDMCKMLPWAIFERDEKGYPHGSPIRTLMVRVVTRAFDKETAGPRPTDTSRALTMLSRTMIRHVGDGVKASTCGELVDTAIFSTFGDRLNSIVEAWRAQWLESKSSELLDRSLIWYYPEAMSVLSTLMTASLGVDVSRAELIATAIEVKWGKQLRSMASHFYGAPMINPEVLKSLQAAK